VSKRNGRNKQRLVKLNQIQKIDKRLKTKKVRENEEEAKKLQSQRAHLCQQLKTK
tara:strand:- start:1231 stop:1395 length:165 start_codon:yes stop_codon:yes gene_type:complete